MSCEIETPFGYITRTKLYRSVHLLQGAYHSGYHTQEILAPRVEHPNNEQVFDYATVNEMNQKLLREASRSNLKEGVSERVLSSLQLKTCERAGPCISTIEDLTHFNSK
jgi:hypothetical protein